MPVQTVGGATRGFERLEELTVSAWVRIVGAGPRSQGAGVPSPRNDAIEMPLDASRHLVTREVGAVECEQPERRAFERSTVDTSDRGVLRQRDPAAVGIIGDPLVVTDSLIGTLGIQIGHAHDLVAGTSNAVGYGMSTEPSVDEDDGRPVRLRACSARGHAALRRCLPSGRRSHERSNPGARPRVHATRPRCMARHHG